MSSKGANRPKLFAAAGRRACQALRGATHDCNQSRTRLQMVEEFALTCRRESARSDGGRDRLPKDETKKRGNYDSGEDYVLEYGDLRFTFNEEDFRQRV